MLLLHELSIVPLGQILKTVNIWRLFSQNISVGPRLCPSFKSCVKLYIWVWHPDQKPLHSPHRWRCSPGFASWWTWRHPAAQFCMSNHLLLEGCNLTWSWWRRLNLPGRHLQTTSSSSCSSNSSCKSMSSRPVLLLDWPYVWTRSSQDVFLNWKLLLADHEKRIVETLFLPECAEDSKEFLGMLGVWNLCNGFTFRERHLASA